MLTVSPLGPLISKEAAPAPVMGDVANGAENNATDVKFFARAVNRFIGSDMRQIAFG